MSVTIVPKPKLPNYSDRAYARQKRAKINRNTTYRVAPYLETFEFGAFAGAIPLAGKLTMAAIVARARAGRLTPNRAAYRALRELGFSHVQATGAAGAIFPAGLKALSPEARS